MKNDVMRVDKQQQQDDDNDHGNDGDNDARCKMQSSIIWKRKCNLWTAKEA
jgi:hypothetical protein